MIEPDYSSETVTEREARLAHHIRGVRDGVLDWQHDETDPEPEQPTRLTDAEVFELTAESREKYPPGHPLNTPPPPPLSEDSSTEDYAKHFNRRP